MTDRKEVIKCLEKCRRCECDDCTEKGASKAPWDCPAYDDFVDSAIAMLKEQEAKQYNSHDVACIIADLFCDPCACNFNDIDTWLPYKCDFSENWCPNPAGVGCWEQYLKHREGEMKLNESTNCKETDSPSR